RGILIADVVLVPLEDGDRPYVVFPCGVVRVDSTTLLLSYGAADQFVGIAAIDLNELLSELDSGRIY
ncbi:MAG TPA: DUF137 domain-containing protein, partial [Pyrodictium sp.]|nr:DUF137 domain-containing protein [Pyrodictium sp.]